MIEEQDQQQEQQHLQQLRPYRYSVKIEMTAKGLCMPSIHVYSDDAHEAVAGATTEYINIIDDLKAKGLKVASDNGS